MSPALPEPPAEAGVYGVLSGAGVDDGVAQAVRKAGGHDGFDVVLVSKERVSSRQHQLQLLLQPMVL